MRYNTYVTMGRWDKMKFQATDYTPEDICRILREWVNMTQDEFGKTINRSGRSVRMLESGESHLTVETLLNIARTHGIKITVEKEVKGQK